VLVLTASDSDSLAKDALAHGAQDYIVKGQFDGNSLSRSLRYAILRAQRDPGQANDQTRPSRARVIGLMGAKGGTGTTAVAIHLAVDIRRQTGKEILLVDLDVSGGSVGFLMKVDRPYTLQDASLNLHRLDAALWQSFVSRHESGVDVLQSAGSIRFGEQLREERVRHLLRLVQMQYAWIILDMGRLTELSLALLEEVGELALVTTPDVSSLQEVRKIVQKLRGTGYDPDRLSLIMNRASRSDISKGDLEKTIGTPVRFCFPDSGGELDHAYASGELQPAHSSFGKQIAKVAASLTGIVPNEAKRWKLFGRSLATPSMQAGR
jgi:pilus assembly protein CpaE